MPIGRLIDVSSNNHPNGAPIDWLAVAKAGVTAAFIKATDGTGYINPYFQPDIVDAQAAGLAVCAYHFAEMGDPRAEAIRFRQIAWRFARMLDYETNTDVAWARTFLQTLELPPGECITYGSASSLAGIYQQLPSLAFPAAYGQGYPGWGACWQWTDKASIPGIVGDVDEDSWHGTESQYDALFQLNIAPPQPIGASMAITAPFLHNGQKQFVQAAIGSLWHKWAPFGPGQNETLAGPGGGTALGCSNFKVTVADSMPGVTTYADGSVDITFEGTDGSPWLISQAALASEWTGGKTA
jgi:hypothetical protein